MKEHDLISVIVPIYNVKNYLRKCLESIIKQTYDNLEIILVDDGSTDDCGIICDEYKKKDTRIKVVHKKNGGLSDARNKGIEVNTGKYIMFIDSDDYVKENMIEVLYNNIITTNADISICDFIKVYDNNEEYNNYSKKEFIVEGDMKYENLYNEFHIVTVIQCNKLFKSELFNNLRFQKGKLNEDEYIIGEELYKAKSISYILEPLYYYCQRSTSIMHTFKKERFDIVEGLKDREELFKKNNLKKFEIIEKEHRFHLLIGLLVKYNSVKKTKEEKKYIKQIIKNNKKNAKNLLKENISFKDKIEIIMFLYFRWLIYLLVKFKKSKS